MLMKKTINSIGKHSAKLIFICLALSAAFIIFSYPVKAKTYKVTPANVAKNCKNYKDYNKYTKHSFGLNYYMQKMEKKGGTLVLKKGTYKLSHTVYVPSNVTIILEDGVVLENIFNTGDASFKPSQSMFMLCPYSKRHKENSIKKYKGSKSIKFIGKGTVVIDNNYGSGAAVICSHNKDIKFSGITFKNMENGHFIELSGTNKAEIINNVFMNAYTKTKNKYYNKEAINIDCDDPTTGGLNAIWSKQDKTPCKNIIIKNNVFDNVTRGIGTHKYSQENGKNVYHTNITISNNMFKNIYDNGVFVLNWKNTRIVNNEFADIGINSQKVYSSGSHGISGGGVEKIKITGNIFTNIKRNAINFCVQKNVGAGSQYSKVVLNITDDEIRVMQNNTVSNCGYDDNKKYVGYDVLIFRGDGERKEQNSAGINYTTGEVFIQ